MAYVTGRCQGCGAFLTSVMPCVSPKTKVQEWLCGVCRRSRGIVGEIRKESVMQVVENKLKSLGKRIS